MSSHSDHQANRRRKLLIEPNFQIGFLIHTLLGALMTSAIFYVANRLFFWKFTDYGRQAGLAPDHVFFKFLATQQSQMNQIYVGTVIFVCAFLIGYGLMYSNRVAGPIFHLRKYLKIYARGKTDQPLRFRRNDLFTDLEPLINEALYSAKARGVDSTKEHEKKAS